MFDYEIFGSPLLYISTVLVFAQARDRSFTFELSHVAVYFEQVSES